jgi:hypothetical protein
MERDELITKIHDRLK